MRISLLAAATAAIVSFVGMPAMAETLSSYLEAANAELKAKQEALMKSLEPLEPYRYDWSLETRILSILKPETGEVLKEYSFIPVGSYSTQTRSWRWSWANDSVPGSNELMKTFAPMAERFLPEHKSFVTPLVEEVEFLYGQDMTAVAIKHLGGIGMWRDGDPEGVVVYFVVME